MDTGGGYWYEMEPPYMSVLFQTSRLATIVLEICILHNIYLQYITFYSVT